MAKFPSVKHSGFLVPNAKGLADPAMAEPDQIDFNTIANARWGVIEGCEITVTGNRASCSGGTALVNGAIVPLVGGWVDLTTGGSQDRFDLIAVDANGKLVKKEGTATADPVFPDLELNLTLLAAVFCGAAQSKFDDTVMDKRKFLSDSLQTRLAGDSVLIRNVNGSGDYFRVDGDGRTVWNGDTTLQRMSAETLQVMKHLNVYANLTVGGGISAQSNISSANGTLSATNLRRGGLIPPLEVGNLGDLFQNTSTGKIYVRSSLGWQELAAGESVTPYGTVVFSMRPVVEMEAMGWVALDGSQITESAQTHNLFLLPCFSTKITNTSPRKLTLPDMRRRFPFVRFGEVPGTLGGADSFTLTMDQMPRHKHDVMAVAGGQATVKGNTGPAGGHRHTTDTGGKHNHTFDEGDGHAHHGMDNGSEGYVIATMAGGGNSIDAYFNDSSHTYTVRAAQWTRKAKTFAKVQEEGSWHDHTISAVDDHTHPYGGIDLPKHSHDTDEAYKGSGRAVEWSPPFVTVYAFMKL